jgi:hypothetical protein
MAPEAWGRHGATIWQLGDPSPEAGGGGALGSGEDGGSTALRPLMEAEPARESNEER